MLVARPRTRALATDARVRAARPRGRGHYCLHSGCRFLGGTVTAPQARAGRFAAFAVRSRGVHTAIAVVDLTRRRVTFLAPAEGNGHGIAVPRIVVKRDGAIAWIACRGAGTRCAASTPTRSTSTTRSARGSSARRQGTSRPTCP